MGYNVRIVDFDTMYNKVKARFFPRELIIENSVDAKWSVMEEVLNLMSNWVFYPRYFQVSVGNYVVDLDSVNVPGISVATVTNIYSTAELSDIFTIYTQVLSKTPFYYNIIRNQDTFLDFMFIRNLQYNLNRKFKNKYTSFMHVGNKLYLDKEVWDSLRSDGSVLLEFYPVFIGDGSVNSWELYSDEYILILDLMEALIYIREGRSQSELKYTGMDNNYNDLITYEKEKLESVMKRLEMYSISISGKVI